MAAQDELHKLTDKANEAEQRAAAARQQAKAELEKSLNNTRASMEAHAAKVRESAKESQGQVSSWWAEQQLAWNAHVAKTRQSMNERKVQTEAKVAERQAEDAEADAYLAIDYAYGAIEMAEYAVLDAILARENADEAKATASVATTR